MMRSSSQQDPRFQPVSKWKWLFDILAGYHAPNRADLYFRKSGALVNAAQFDAVVVGSGFGGAVTAYRLAEADLDVCVLERGKIYPGTNKEKP